MSMIKELKERINKKEEYVRGFLGRLCGGNTRYFDGKLETYEEILEIIEELEARCKPGFIHNFVLHCVKSYCFNLACNHKQYEKCCYCKKKRSVESREGKG